MGARLQTELCSILLVDDEANVTSSLRRLLQVQGHTILVAANGEEALALLEKNDVRVILTDMRMPKMDGARLLQEVSERWPRIVRILLTGYADLALTTETLRNGWTDHFLTKPWEPDEVEACVAQAIARSRERSET